MYCRVVLRSAVRQTDVYYTYRVPEALRADIYPGSLVMVPFGKGNALKVAVIVDLKDTYEFEDKYLKDVASLIYKYPVLNADQLELIEKISDRFNCTKGDVVELMVPSCVVNHKNPTEMFVEIVSRQTAEQVLESEKLRSAAHINILEYLLERGKCTRKEIMSSVSCSAA